MANSTADPFIEDIIALLEHEKTENGPDLYLPDQVRNDLFKLDTAIPTSAAPREDASRSTSAANQNPPQTTKPTDQPTPSDWNSLARAVAECHNCELPQAGSRPCFENGDRQAELMLIGDLPPDREVEQMLGRMIAAMRFKPKEVYATSIVKCRPPGGRRPDPAEITACIPYVQEQIKLVKPKIIVLLGELALRCLLGQKSITRCRGKWLEYNDIPVMAIYNPLFMLAHPESKKTAWQDLQMVMRRCGRIESRKHGQIL